MKTMLNLFLQGFSILSNWELYIAVIIFLMLYISVQYFNLLKIPAHKLVATILVTPICLIIQSLAEVFLIFCLAPLILWSNEVNWLSFSSLVESSSLIMLAVLVLIGWIMNSFASHVVSVMLGIIYLSTAGNLLAGNGFSLIPNIPDWITVITIVIGGVVSYYLGVLLVGLCSNIFGISISEHKLREYNPKLLFFTIYPVKVLAFVPISIYGNWLASQITPI